MKPKELASLGIPHDCIPVAIESVKTLFKFRTLGSKAQVADAFRAVVADPEAYINTPTALAPLSAVAAAIIASKQKMRAETVNWSTNPLGVPGTYSQWGEDIEEGALQQMRDAVDLPVAVAGALMPDAHQGYGLPIGGVLATYDSVVPYAVGVDIACRMKLSVLDIPPKILDDPFSPKVDPLIRALTGGTLFGVGGEHKHRQDHEVMDMDWTVLSNMPDGWEKLKTRAWKQLGTSGSGNHFAEFGLLTLEQPDMGLAAGTYVALMTHSGSRGVGGAVCGRYVDIAKSRLPKAFEKFQNLAWLPLSSEAGQEYWNAMNLMGEYAKGNHAVIHRLVAQLMGAEVIAGIENHHNFAWKEVHNGHELIVHRKGATPAGVGVLGVIPGSMASPAFVVRGKGKPESLMSASHGAGRCMSRNKAKEKFSWSEQKSFIKNRGVRLLDAGIDEVPGVYKDILKVMAAQSDLVDVVAQFDPKIVRMSADGRSED